MLRIPNLLCNSFGKLNKIQNLSKRTVLCMGGTSLIYFKILCQI